MFDPDEVTDIEEFRDFKGKDWIWNEDYQAFMLKESKDEVKIEDEDDMNAVNSLTADQGKFKGAHCALCHISADKSVMCAVDIESSKLVPFGTAGSRVECLSSSDCKDRKGDKTSTNKYSSGTQYALPKCRHAATQAFSIEGINFYGGSQWKVEDVTFDQKEWLVVSLLGYKSSYSATSGVWSSVLNWNSAFKPYSKINHPQVTIEWPD